jgi:cyclophilin family peptidyl-prolyl cis-trans isomerase
MYVQFTTNKGSFVLELNHEKAPVSVDNFLKYVDDKFYNDTIFHRITKGGIFVIQGGGMDKSGSQKKTNPPIKNEWKNGLTNVRGSISMARTSAPDSATSQFFINVQDDPALDQPNGGAAYAVFGKVYAGMKTIDALYATPVQASRAMGGEVSQPVEPLIVEKAERITAAKAKNCSTPRNQPLQHPRRHSLPRADTDSAGLSKFRLTKQRARRMRRAFFH